VNPALREKSLTLGFTTHTCPHALSNAHATQEQLAERKGTMEREAGAQGMERKVDARKGPDGLQPFWTSHL